jgi:hypothetical protein
LIKLSDLTLALVLSLVAARVQAKECPPSQSDCGTDTCCAASEICCPNGSGACCPANAPYCCGGGTCAATPSACGKEEEPLCPDYEIPCGGSCIEAGSDCCDADGAYCPPTQTCTADACVVADQTRPRMHKTHSASGEPPPGMPLMPTSDPHGPKRSCAIAGARAGKTPGWLFAYFALFAWRCAKRRRTGESYTRRGDRLP